MLDWSDNFRPLLGPSMHAVYEWPGQAPKLPPGVAGILGSSAQSYEGKARTNCTWFTAYLLGNGFPGVKFTTAQWQGWQISAGREHYDGLRYGPRVCDEWGVVVRDLHEPALDNLPVGGVYLAQTIRPKNDASGKEVLYGHSFLILDCDVPTRRLLTLESNSGEGLNGVGFGGIGNLRTTNAADWINRAASNTWERRVTSASEWYVAKLAIDHASVLAWIEEQQS